MRKEAVNTFNGGLNYDLNPITTPNDILTDCINGTFITFNGDELALQNDAGNTRITVYPNAQEWIPNTSYDGDNTVYYSIINNIKRYFKCIADNTGELLTNTNYWIEVNGDVQLSDGFYPLGVKEYGGVLYIVSANKNKQSLLYNFNEDLSSLYHGFAQETITLTAGKTYIFEASGRISIAASMANPIRENKMWLSNETWSFAINLNFTTTNETTKSIQFVAPETGNYYLSSYNTPQNHPAEGVEVVITSWYKIYEFTEYIEFGSYPSPNGVSFGNAITKMIDINNTTNIYNQNYLITSENYNPGNKISFNSTIDENTLSNYSSYNTVSSKWERKIYKLGLYQKLESSLRDITEILSIQNPNKVGNNKYWFYPNNVEYINNSNYKGELITKLEIEPLELYNLAQSTFNINTLNKSNYDWQLGFNYLSNCSILINSVTIKYSIWNENVIVLNEQTISNQIINQNTGTIPQIVLEKVGNYIGYTLKFTITPNFNYTNLPSNYISSYIITGTKVIPNIYELINLEPNSLVSTISDINKYVYEYNDKILLSSKTYNEVILKNDNNQYITLDLEPINIISNDKYGFRLADSTLGSKLLISDSNLLGTYNINDGVVTGQITNTNYNHLSKLTDILETLTLETNGFSELNLQLEYSCPLILNYGTSDYLVGIDPYITYVDSDRNIIDIPGTHNLLLYPKVLSNTCKLEEPSSPSEGDIWYKGYADGYKKRVGVNWTSISLSSLLLLYKICPGDIKISLSDYLNFNLNITDNTTLKIAIVPEIININLTTQTINLITYRKNEILLSIPSAKSYTTSDKIKCSIKLEGTQSNSVIPYSRTVDAYFKKTSDFTEFYLYVDNVLFTTLDYNPNVSNVVTNITKLTILSFNGASLASSGYLNVPDNSDYSIFSNGLVMKTPYVLYTGLARVLISDVTATPNTATITIHTTRHNEQVTVGIEYSKDKNFTVGTVLKATEQTLNSNMVDPFTTQTFNLTNLIGNTNYYIRCYIKFKDTLFINYGNNYNFFTALVSNPIITTAQGSILSSSVIQVYGTNINAFGGTILRKGICYSTTEANPTINDLYIDSNNTESTDFNIIIQYLNPNTLYHTRTYVITDYNIAYGNVVDITTLVALPSITTVSATPTSTTTADVVGNVTNTGGGVLSERGICYALTHNPTTANSKVSVAGQSGIFTANLINLTPVTTYYTRAYSINSAGTSYGDEVSFITTVIPTLTLNSVNSIEYDYTKVLTNFSITPNGSAITENGIWYGLDPNPELTGTQVVGTLNVLNLLITGLTKGLTYYFKAYAINSSGTGYSNEVSKLIPYSSAPTIELGITARNYLIADDIEVIAPGNGRIYLHNVIKANGSPIISVTLKYGLSSANLTNTSTNYIDNEAIYFDFDLGENVNYYFKLEIVNADGTLSVYNQSGNPLEYSYIPYVIKRLDLLINYIDGSGNILASNDVTTPTYIEFDTQSTIHPYGHTFNYEAKLEDWSVVNGTCGILYGEWELIGGTYRFRTSYYYYMSQFFMYNGTPIDPSRIRSISMIPNDTDAAFDVMTCTQQFVNSLTLDPIIDSVDPVFTNGTPTAFTGTTSNLPSGTYSAKLTYSLKLPADTIWDGPFVFNDYVNMNVDANGNFNYYELFSQNQWDSIAVSETVDFKFSFNITNGAFINITKEKLYTAIV